MYGWTRNYSDFAGEFVSKNMLEVGDKLSLYQDVFKNVVSHHEFVYAVKNLPYYTNKFIS